MSAPESQEGWRQVEELAQATILLRDEEIKALVRANLFLKERLDIIQAYAKSALESRAEEGLKK